LGSHAEYTSSALLEFHIQAMAGPALVPMAVCLSFCSWFGDKEHLVLERLLTVGVGLRLPVLLRPGQCKPGQLQVAAIDCGSQSLSPMGSLKQKPVSVKVKTTPSLDHLIT